MAYTDDYVKTNWVNKPATNTPINQTNLNHMEQGIKNNCGRVANLSTTKAEQSDLLVSFKNVTFDSTTGTFTFTKFDNTTITVNTDLEKLAVNFDYDDDPTSPHYQNLVITLSDGTIKYADLSALVTQYEFTNTSTISFTIGTGGVITANVIDGSITADKLQPNFLADCQAAKTDAENAANSAESDALVAEGYAKGTQNGTPVGSDSEYYENNAEYFKNQASAIVGPKVTSFNGRENIVISQKGDYDADMIEFDPSTTSLPNTLETLQDFLEYAYPLGTTVTLTLNGAKEDQITIKDSNNQTVATCTFAAGQTSGSVQLTVPVGGASFKFVSSKAKGITSETLSSDYEKTVVLTDAASQTVNVYPGGAVYWYGNQIKTLTAWGVSGWTLVNPVFNTNSMTLPGSGSTSTSGVRFDLGTATHIKVMYNLPTTIDAENNNVAFTQLNASNTKVSTDGWITLGGTQAAGTYVYDNDFTPVGTATQIAVYTYRQPNPNILAIIATNGHEDDLTIYGAKEDTITITDSQNQTVATCVFGSGSTVGYVSKSLLPSGTYTFTSSVAKDTTDGTSDYTKTITLDGSENEVKVMPDGALYWYGNKAEAISTYWNGYGSPTTIITEYTQHLNIHATVGGKIGIFTDNAFNLSQYTKISVRYKNNQDAEGVSVQWGTFTASTATPTGYVDDLTATTITTRDIDISSVSTMEQIAVTSRTASSGQIFDIDIYEVTLIE